MRTIQFAILFFLVFGVAATAIAEWRYGPSYGPLPVAWKWLFDHVPWSRNDKSYDCYRRRAASAAGVPQRRVLPPNAVIRIPRCWHILIALQDAIREPMREARSAGLLIPSLTRANAVRLGGRS
jgi:hypothetical protein